VERVRGARLIAAQEALLDFDTSQPDEAWVQGVVEALRPVLRTEKLYLLGPDGARDQNSRLQVFAAPLGEDFAPRLERYFVGYADDGATLFKEDYATELHRLVRALGTRAVHDAPLYDERQRKDTRLHQEIFEPCDVLRQMAISVPGAVGETMVIAGYSDGVIPSADSAIFEDLQLLTPAFECAIRFRRLLSGRVATYVELIDRIPEALILFGIAGREHHRNTACVALLAAEPDSERMNHCIAEFAARALGRAAPIGPRALAAVSTRTRFYILRAMQDRNGGTLTISISSPNALPEAGLLQRKLGLTKRETDVLGHLASGMQTKQIAFELGISVHTARRHTEGVMRKLGTNSRSALLKAAWKRVAQITPDP